MVEVIRQGGVDVGERQVVFGGDLVGAASHTVVPDDDVFNGDAPAGDPRLSRCDARRDFDVLVQGRWSHVMPRTWARASRHCSLLLERSLVIILLRFLKPLKQSSLFGPGS